jgi:hypothetical protein
VIDVGISPLNIQLSKLTSLRIQLNHEEFIGLREVMIEIL